MSIHDETKHPRNLDAENTGEFGPKIPTDQEIDDLDFAEDEADDYDVPSSLAIGESLIYSHADGDFDGTELGIEGIEVVRQDDGTLHAQAYTYLDFAYLAQLHTDGRTTAALDVWLDAHRDEVANAVNSVLPAGSIDDDDNNSWADRRLIVDLTPVGSEFPDSADGVIRLAQTSAALAQVNAVLNEDGDEDLFWSKVSAAFQA